MALTAAPLLPGFFQFLDGAGAPLAGGLVYTFAPNTSTPKTAWLDPLQVAQAANPITLDSAGRCVMFGSGQYRLQLFDVNGLLIEDNLAAAADENSIIAGLTPFVGDTGSGGSQGVVPAPPAGSAAQGLYLGANGTWQPLNVVLPTVPAPTQAGFLYPQNRTQSTTTGALVLTDAGSNVSYNNAAAGSITIPNDATVVWPLGVVTQIMLSNPPASGAWTITRAAGVSLVWPGSSATSANRILAANGQCVISRTAPNGWTVVGAGLS